MNLGHAVYVLCEPGTGEIRYIGYTGDTAYRLKQHCREVGRTRKNRWIQKLKRSGQIPVLRVLCFVRDAIEAKRVEIALIAKYRKKKDCRLINATDGGDGLLNPSKEVRARLSAVAKNRPPELKAQLSHLGRQHSSETKQRIRAAASNISEETRAKMKESARNRPPISDETRAKMVLLAQGRNTGRLHSAQTRAKIGAASRGRKQSPETVAKRMATIRGFSPERKAKISAAVRAAIANRTLEDRAAIGAKISAKSKGVKRTREVTEKMRESMKEVWRKKREEGKSWRLDGYTRTAVNKPSLTDSEVVSRLRALQILSTPYLAGKLRRQAGLTLDEVGAELGVVFSTVSHWETGRSVPKGTMAASYVNLLSRYTGLVVS